MASFSVTNSTACTFALCFLLGQLVPVFMLHLAAKTLKRRIFITHLLELVRLLSVAQLVSIFFLDPCNICFIFAQYLFSLCALCCCCFLDFAFLVNKQASEKWSQSEKTR